MKPAHEPETLPRGLILRTLFVTVMIGVALCFATVVILRGLVLSVRPGYHFPEQALPAPREVAGVRQELFRIANARPTEPEMDERALEGFGWVDRPHRIVHIPIDAAIDLIAGRTGR